MVARIDGLLARADPGELQEEEQSVSRDGSRLALHRSDSGSMLIVTSGPALPSALSQELLQLLTDIAAEEAAHDAPIARAA